MKGYFFFNTILIRDWLSTAFGARTTRSNVEDVSVKRRWNGTTCAGGAELQRLVAGRHEIPPTPGPKVGFREQTDGTTEPGRTDAVHFCHRWDGDVKRSFVVRRHIIFVLYSIGGGSLFTIHSAGECYNPRHDRWLPIAPMSKCRSRAGIVALGKLIYAIGG